MLESANTSLAQLETSVANQTASYASTVQDAVGTTQQAGDLVATQVAALQQTVRTMIDDFSSMMGSLHSEVTVIDQAAKKRKSVSDALGRLAQVYEDPQGANHLTSYGYDALDNLTTVTQGEQTRTFVYD